MPPRQPTSVSGGRAPGSVAVRGRLDRSRRLAQRAARLLARGQAGHPLVRRSRVLPRRQRRRLPGDSRGLGDVHLADGAGTVGPPRRRAVRRRRRRRRPPHAQRRERPLPLGSAHPRPVVALRRRWVPLDGRRPVGTRRSRRGAPRTAHPGRAGAGVGHRRHPPGTAPHVDHVASGVLRHLSRARRRVRPPDSPAVDDLRGAGRISRSGASPPRRESSSPITSTTTGARAVAPARSPPSTHWAPESPRSTSNRPIDTPEVRALTPHADAWIDDLALALDPDLATRIDEVGATLIGYGDLRAAMRDG